MKLKLFILLALCSNLFFACKKDLAEEELPVLSERKSAEKGNPHTKIAILSDIHYMHPSLLSNNGENGTAFQEYLNQDPKLVQYSDAIFRKALAEVRAEKPDILLLPGDITKDGEKIGHQAIATFLEQVRSEGTLVYVVPGNHDINNAKAKKFVGNTAIPVDKTSSADFASIYGNFGYNTALSRDANSLSYIASPKPGLWIMAIDASKYEEYGPEGDVAAGRIKPSTLSWMLLKLAEAKQKNITVFGMMHHNLIEHYKGQSTLDPGYVIDDWQNVANKLIDAGLKTIFTGHYHANDISSYSHNGKEITDIQTGSLVTAPIPYRMVLVKNNKLEVSSRTVQSIATNLPGGVSFPAYANLFLSQHLDGYFNYYLANNLGAPASLATFASPLFRNAIMAHFAGDEKMPADQRQQINQLSTMSAQMAAMVTTLWTDTGIEDNITKLDY